MLRYRRYRVFVAFAVITIFALYKFGTSSTSWRDDSSVPVQLEGQQGVAPVLSRNPRPEVALETKKLQIDVPLAKTSQARQTPPPIDPVSRPVPKPTPPPPPPPPSPTAKPDAMPKPIGAGGAKPELPLSTSDGQPLAGSQGELEAAPEPLQSTSTVEELHWKKQSEYYPVASASLQKLPTGAAKSIPKIQTSFKKESETAKASRLSRLNMIKEVFKRSWDGYKEFAWLHDELKPKSGTYRDPFAGWGATLVDALDTLWIMGMKEEFEEAVKAVDKIDFTYTPYRLDIPLFETTIRYLGGFIAAYDLSDKVHKNLLDKAVELAEILMSAFDTPNRMPETYYHWQPDFSSRPLQSSNHIVLAEIGSLSLEFTRLAQLTGDNKYYDAIARITDNLEEFQDKTRLQGMWPTHFDASGCKRIDYTKIGPPIQKPLENVLPVPSEEPTSTEKLSPGGNKYLPLDLPSPIVFHAEPGNAPIENRDQDTSAGDPDLEKATNNLKKRQLDLPELPQEEDVTVPSEATVPAIPTPALPVCEKQGFVGFSELGTEEYTLGGESDSTYEYLPKEWLLLGGRVGKYQTMYEKAMDVVKKNLIFRPMLPNGDDILFSGKLRVSAPDPEVPTKGQGVLEGENAHLTCFAGGMFGMGAKIFDRPDDLEIAKKLVQGCVWSYGMTTTGIMPEAFLTVPCESMKDCAWNETQYKLAIDPHAENRVRTYERQMETFEQQMAAASALYASQMAEYTAALKTPAPPINVEPPTATPAPPTVGETIQKRRLDTEDAEPQTVPELRMPQSVPPPRPHANLMVEGDGDLDESETAPEPRLPQPAIPPRPHANLMVEGEGEADEEEIPPTPVILESTESAIPTLIEPEFPSIWSPTPPLTHDEYVKMRVQEERLPEGVISIPAKGYILRPEAIESVWYMYRITGDPHWREEGWRMFEAVNTHTTVEFGNSAIDDVTSRSPTHSDESESFWLAETLKYFYLLFADENVVNLDEWVLNTEAHPFRRPT